MKIPFIIFILTFNLTMFGQAAEFAGDYSNRMGDEVNKFEYNLKLNQDGTFFCFIIFHI